MTGDLYFEKAKKILKNRFYIFGSKNIDALNMLEKAIVFFKQNQSYEKLCDIYELQASLYEKLDDSYEQIQSYENAYKVGIKFDIDRGYKNIQKAISLHIDKGNFKNAAKCGMNMAEIFETECDYINSIKLYEQAINNYLIDDTSIIILQKCYEKVAEISVKLEDYKKDKKYMKNWHMIIVMKILLSE